MKRLILTSLMVLALAGSSALASQNKNKAPKRTTKPKTTASASTNTGSTNTSGKARHHRRRHHRVSKGTSKTTKNANKTM